jgi:5'(3')-deoxyribonucleotidase
MSERPPIFIDLDGVLDDFVRGAFTAFGRPLDAETLANVRWNFWGMLGCDNETELWDVIDCTTGFWESLVPYPWASDLVAAAEEVGTVRLLSSPSKDPMCLAGKKRWVNTHFPALRLLPFGEKELLAKPGRILIDDNDGNCEKWRAAGGIAILFPQPWNNNREFTVDPLGHVLEQLAIVTDPAHADTGSVFPSESKSRKKIPLCTGVLDYFPDALFAVCEVSRKGSEQHHPGEPIHWDKSKSSDEADALLRHLIDRGKLDSDGMRHSAKVAWRGLCDCCSGRSKPKGVNSGKLPHSSVTGVVDRPAIRSCGRRLISSRSTTSTTMRGVLYSTRTCFMTGRNAMAAIKSAPGG